MSVEMRPSVMRQRYGGGNYPSDTLLAVAAEDVKKRDAVGYEFELVPEFEWLQTAENVESMSDDGGVVVEKASNAPRMRIHRLKDGALVQDPNPVREAPSSYSYYVCAAGKQIFATLSGPSNSGFKYIYDGSTWQMTNVKYHKSYVGMIRPSYTGEYYVYGKTLCKRTGSDGYFADIYEVFFEPPGIGDRANGRLSQDELLYIVQSRTIINNTLKLDIYIYERESREEQFAQSQRLTFHIHVPFMDGENFKFPDSFEISPDKKTIYLSKVVETRDPKDLYDEYTVLIEVILKRGKDKYYAHIETDGTYGSGWGGLYNASTHRWEQTKVTEQFVLGRKGYNAVLYEVGLVDGRVIKKVVKPSDSYLLKPYTRSKPIVPAFLVEREGVPYISIYEKNSMNEMRLARIATDRISKGAAQYSLKHGFAKEDIKRGERGKVKMLFGNEEV